MLIGLLMSVSIILQYIAKKTSFPYTVALVILGFLAQLIVHLFHLDTHLLIDPLFIYYFILPLMLFEAAMHIDVHQFRLQFWTISFMSTFGLLVSMAVVGFGLFYLLGLPLGVSLLFGALISATDPIAVLAIFKTLGAPKRLALLADGESMFNDATAVIAFKLVAAFVLSSTFVEGQKLLTGFGTFGYMFFGSIVVGALIGYLGSELVRRIKDDPIIEATLTFSLVFGIFVLSDHFLGLSGVITTVMAGIIFGNLGKTRISIHAREFVNGLWEYLAFLSVTIVFFFASFQLNPDLLLSHLNQLPLVISLVLAGRAISVYLSFFISNRAHFFHNEPDVPLTWQHILNWGGLRGVIPLVLVYSLPDDFAYKQLLISYTVASFVFTLLINALTIRWLLEKLQLNLPQKEELLIKEEHQLYEIEKKRELLQKLPKRDFYNQIINQASQRLNNAEQQHLQQLESMADPEQLKLGLQLQAIRVIRQKIEKLFHRGQISEAVALEYDSQLDLQQDALEYPEVYYGRGYQKGGRLPNNKLFRERLRHSQQWVRNFGLLRRFIGQSESDLILERFMMLKAKIICTDQVLNYLKFAKPRFKNSQPAMNAINQVAAEYQERRIGYQKDIDLIKKQYPATIKQYQSQLLDNLING